MAEVGFNGDQSDGCVYVGRSGLGRGGPHGTSHWYKQGYGRETVIGSGRKKENRAIHYQVTTGKVLMHMLRKCKRIPAKSSPTNAVFRLQV